MNWKQTLIDLGTLKVNQVTNVVFDYIGSNPDLVTKATLHASCGCSVPSWNPETKQLIVVYTPNPIPIHLKQQGKHSYVSNGKYILISYGNNITDKLTFTALITE